MTACDDVNSNHGGLDKGGSVEPFIGHELSPSGAWNLSTLVRSDLPFGPGSESIEHTPDWWREDFRASASPR